MIRGVIENKRGSHVGVIASFGIFVIFLVALYFVVEPTVKTQRSKRDVLKNLEQELRRELSSKLTTVIVSSGGGACLSVSNSNLGIDNEGAIVKDRNNNLIASGFDAGNLIIDPSSETTLWIYYSDEFQKNSKANSGCSAPTIASVRDSEEIFQSRIAGAISNFEAFKSNISIAPNNEFSFSVTLSNGTVIGVGSKNVSKELYVDEIPIQYINSDSNNLGGKLTIKVWDN